MLISRRLALTEGRIAIVTDVERGMRWLLRLQALCAPTNELRQTAKSCGPDSPTLESSLLMAGDGGYQSPDTGEITYKPLNHRAGNAGLFRRACGF
jgi:hypothetical protein